MSWANYHGCRWLMAPGLARLISREERHHLEASGDESRHGVRAEALLRAGWGVGEVRANAGRHKQAFLRLSAAIIVTPSRLQCCR